MHNDVLEPPAPAVAAAKNTKKSAPPSSAPVEEKYNWCSVRVAGVIAITPIDESTFPEDVRPTHLHEVEMVSCVLDPQEYERATDDVLTRID